MMKKIFIFLPLVFGSVFSFADEIGNCPDYLKGLSNPHITRFGGLTPRTPVQDMANLFLSYLPYDADRDMQIAIPAFIESTPDQLEQFGDKQRNARAHYGPLYQSPFVAVLKREVTTIDSAELAVKFSASLPNFDKIKAIDFSANGKTLALPVDKNGLVRIPVSLSELGWNKPTDAKFAYFRPVGWTEWFAVQFPNPYLKVNDLVSGMAPSSQQLPDGRSVVDPLQIKGSENLQDRLRESPNALSSEFPLVHVDRATRVHGVYKTSNGPEYLATGGLWTRYRDAAPFKIVYLAKDGRAVDIEEDEGTVSGTGPHYIGATGEIILNSLSDESLMTFYGVQAAAQTPDGKPLAWGFTHQWVGKWLRPDEAFVTPRGLFHWHLNHQRSPIAAQVFTPPEVPSSSNHHGFPKP